MQIVNNRDKRLSISAKVIFVVDWKFMFAS